jgi:2-dehydropantoate 2-reductase
LTWQKTGETKTTRHIQVFASLAEALTGRGYDCLVLAVKAYDVAAFAGELNAITHAPPAILSLQNGVSAETDLTSIFGPESVIAGTVTSPVSRGANGDLVIEKKRGVGLALGHPLSQPLASGLNQAGLRTRLYPAAIPMKWSKLFTNLVGNASSAILDMPVGELFADPRLYSIELETLRECLRVMRGLHVPVVDLPGVPARLLAWAVSSLPAAAGQPILSRAIGGARGAKRPSLNLDVQAGRPRTEVRWLNGAVVQQGERLGIPTPVNRALTDTVEALTAGQLSLDTFRHRPDALLRLMSN